MSSTVAKIIEITSTQSGVVPHVLSEFTSFRYGTKLDSLDLAEVIMIAEEKFNVRISDGELAKCSTIGDLARIIDAKKS